MKENKKIQFISCPACSGNGKKKNSTCSNCGGTGVGVLWRGRFFYWGLRLGIIVIELNHFRKRFNFFVNAITYTIGFLGLLSLFYWFFQASQAGVAVALEDFYFWRIKSIWLLLFWVSAIFDMFVIFRLSQEKQKMHKIVQFRYEDENKKYATPNNWDELRKMKSKFKIDVSSGFSEEAINIIENSFILAKKAKHKEVEVMHLFFSLFKNRDVMAAFSRLNIDVSKLISKIKKQLLKIESQDSKTELSSNLKEVLIEAYFNSYEIKQKRVNAVNLILPCMKKNNTLLEILYDLEIDKDKINNVIQWFNINEKIVENYKMYRKIAKLKPGSNMDRAFTSVATPVLNNFAYDLTIAAKWGRIEICVSREQEIKNVFDVLESGRKGAMLVGPIGVGKNSIIGGIAQLMVSEDVPEILRDKRLVELDAARLVSGATPAQAEERMLVMIDEITRAGNIILYIDNIENIIGITAGSEESLDLSEVLASALERGSIYCFASATSMNYTKYIEGKPLGNIMTKIEIAEPEDNQAIQIIESKIGYFEKKHDVYFSYNAISDAVKLSKRYMHDKYLPEKAIEILELAAVKASKESESKIVDKRIIAKIISEITKIPITKVTQSESKVLLNLEDKIHGRMINQKEAVDMVAASLRRARAELHQGKRPIASFLFLGPTGVGKTELAKTVSEIYFGDEKYMIRLDMSEYQLPDSVNKMIGDDNDTGYLTEAVRKAPFSLILLDEIEKAHPDILNLFLQVMDDGRLTDGQGRTIDFTNSIIIATSNIGAVFIQDKIREGEKIEKIKDGLINEHLNKFMRPELVNRFDGVVVFKPLTEENVVDIARLMLNKIDGMLEAKGIDLKAEEDGIRKLARLGFDPKFGARPLRRLLQDKVENIIANKILAGELDRRDIVLINKNGEIDVEKGREL